VFADEWGLRVFAGPTGDALFQHRLGSCTGYENPVVADLDGDGRAELIAVANTSCGIMGNIQHGVFVFGSDAWVGARGIWNQHTYHVRNVADDGSIPSPEPAGPSTFRCNAISPCPYALPDLTASFLRVTNLGVDAELVVRIGNGGASTAPANVEVRFYDGDPQNGGTLLATGATTVYLAPGDFEDVAVVVPAAPTTGTIWIVADDQGGLASGRFESDEANNIFDSGVQL
jgi:hypothetical protein